MSSKGLRTLFVFLLASVSAFAQGTTSRVLGTVQDPSGATIANATVKLVNEGTKVSFTTQSSETGNYAFEAVQPGAYELQVEAAGFRRFSSRNNQVNIGQPATINARLEVGQLAEQVTVEGTAEVVQTSSSGNYGNVVAQQVIMDLPIVGSRGRNPLELVITQPGVVSGSNTGGGIHVHGARDRAWNYTLDGIDLNDSSQGGSNTTSFRVNPDMLAEMRVLVGNSTAENGRNSGGQAAMMTRSGTNEIHGNGFWFYRTPKLNANEWERNLDGIVEPQIQQNIFGGGIGGPIKKNKTFFFFQTQMLRARTSSAVTRTVYTQSARDGVLRYVRGGRNQPAGAPGASVDNAGNPLAGLNIGTYNIGTSDPQRLGLDPTVSAMMKAAPLPNTYTVGDGLNTAGFIFSALASERQRDYTVKIDHMINSSNTLYGRAVWGRNDSLCDIVNGGQPVFPGGLCLVNTLRGPRNFAFNWRTTPNARMTNELVVGQNRYDPIFGQPADLDKTTFLSTPVASTATYSFGNQRVVSTWQVVDNFSYFHGAHNFKFGANLRRVREEDQRGSVAGLNATQELNFSTSVNTVDPATFGLPADLNTAFDRPNFQSHINFLLGRVGTIQRGFVASNNEWVKSTFLFDTRFPEYEFYGQDTWKVKPNLTIDYGLRWELRLAPSTPADNLKVPSQPMVAGASPSNTVRWTPGDLFKSQTGNWGPSLGFAWDPFKNGKTSIRANYRIAYDRINMFVIASQILPNLPGAAIGVVNTAFGQGGGRLRNLPNLAPPATKPNDLTQPVAYSNNTNTVLDPNLKTPRTHQWALNIQREIARNTVIDIAYIGRRAYHLLGAYNTNQAQIVSNGFLDAFKTIKAGGESASVNSLLRFDSRLNANETASAMIRRLFASNLSLNSVGALAGSLANRMQGTQSVTALGGQPFFFYPYPQYLNGLNVLDSNDISTYNALEIQITRRLKNGVSFHAGYTWSKSLDTRSFDPTITVVSTGSSQSSSSTPYDIYNRGLNYSYSDFDRRHSFQANGLWELPFGKGKHFLSGASGALEKAIGGWEVSGFGRLTTGRPFTVNAGTNTFSNVNQTTANCSTCKRGDGSPFTEPNSGLIWFFQPGDRTSKFSAPGAGEFGNLARNFFEGPRWFEINMSLLKRVQVNERFRLEFRGDATNLTNTPSFGFPTTDISSSLFGRIRNTVSSYSRKVQVGAKLYF